MPSSVIHFSLSAVGHTQIRARGVRRRPSLYSFKHFMSREDESRVEGESYIYQEGDIHLALQLPPPMAGRLADRMLLSTQMDWELYVERKNGLRVYIWSVLAFGRGRGTNAPAAQMSDALSILPPLSPLSPPSLSIENVMLYSLRSRTHTHTHPCPCVLADL